MPFVNGQRAFHLDVGEPEGGSPGEEGVTTDDMWYCFAPLAARKDGLGFPNRTGVGSKGGW